MSSIARGLGGRSLERTAIGFWESEAKSLVAGDIIVEILPTVPSPDQRQRFHPIAAEFH